MSIYDYDPDQKPKMSKEQRDEMMKKFLEKGGKVQKLKPGYPTNVGSLDKSRKPAFTKEDIRDGKTGHAPTPDYGTYKKGNDRQPSFIDVVSSLTSFIRGLNTDLTLPLSICG